MVEKERSFKGQFNHLWLSFESRWRRERELEVVVIALEHLAQLVVHVAGDLDSLVV